MPLSVFAIVLFAAVMHAGWNAVVKGGRDTVFTTVLVAGSAALVSALALPVVPPVVPDTWPYLVVSALLEICYYSLVAATYRIADMSQAYPLMRGTAPVIVVLVGTLLLGEHLTPVAWLGIGLVCAGILSIALLHRGRPGSARGARLALLNACIIASYTLIDGFGVRHSGSAAAYTMWVFVLTGLPLLGWALLRHRRSFLAYARHNWHLGLAGGFGTLASYGLALWAMTQAPIPLVAALRETSILFGTAIAALLLNERITRHRIVAVAIIALGAIALRLA
jgi:drug/metabolite transporter (DMT)-like permease